MTVNGVEPPRCALDRLKEIVQGVKPRVLWRLVYLVPVVAGCDCSWRWRSGAQAASCSAGVRIPMAECGRVVLNQWTHSAVATTGGVDVLPRALVTDQLGLVQRVERLGQGEAERRPPLEPTEVTASQSDRACP